MTYNIIRILEKSDESKQVLCMDFAMWISNVTEYERKAWCVDILSLVVLFGT